MYLPPLSAPSLPFAEVLIAEIALRNRDRIACLWSLLAEHYRVRCGSAGTLSFSVEKAITGLLRVISRMVSRPGMGVQLVDALSWLVPPHLDPSIAEVMVPHISAGILRLVTAHAPVLTSVRLMSS